MSNSQEQLRLTEKFSLFAEGSNIGKSVNLQYLSISPC